MDFEHLIIYGNIAPNLYNKNPHEASPPFFATQGDSRLDATFVLQTRPQIATPYLPRSSIVAVVAYIHEEKAGQASAAEHRSEARPSFFARLPDYNQNFTILSAVRSIHQPYEYLWGRPASTLLPSQVIRTRSNSTSFAVASNILQ